VIFGTRRLDPTGHACAALATLWACLGDTRATHDITAGRCEKLYARECAAAALAPEAAGMEGLAVHQRAALCG